MSNLKWVGFAGLLLCVSSSAFAVGTTGCGLGSMIFTRNTFVSQTFAATTNTTGLSYSLTTQTSNCRIDGFVMNEKEKEYYVESNFRHLEVEMAQGKGENLTAFAGVLGCDPSVVSAFGEMTQSRYESIFTSDQVTPAQVLDSVQKEVKAHPILSKSCASVS